MPRQGGQTEQPGQCGHYMAFSFPRLQPQLALFIKRPSDTVIMGLQQAGLQWGGVLMTAANLHGHAQPPLSHPFYTPFPPNQH